MAPPAQISQWLRNTYPKPRIDPEWLDGCYSWIESEFGLNPQSQIQDIIRNVDLQLLESDLADSMLAGTGLPQNVAELHNVPGPNVRQARLEREDMAGLAREEDDEDEGPIPAYPHSMLRFQLSDGSTILQAIEYRRLPGLVLGETKLGFKMVLKDVSIRGGIAFLEPQCVIMKGHQAADLDALQDRDFARGLRLRLGKPDDPAQEEPQPVDPPAPAAPAPHPREQVPVPEAVRSPLRELAKSPSPPAAGPSGTSHTDDEGQPRRRKLPSRSQHSPSPNPPPRPNRQPTHSHYFPSASASGSSSHNPSAELARERLFSPPRQPPIVVPDSDDEDDESWHVRASAILADPGHSRQPAEDAKPKAPSSDDFVFDDEIYEDDAFLQQVDRLEREALAGNGGSTQSSRATGSSTTLAEVRTGSPTAVSSLSGPSSSSGSGGRSGPGSGSNAVRNNRTGGIQSGAAERVDLGVINVEDSEDEKENVPVPTRRVRRRMARPTPSQEDVIELSD